MSGSDIDKSFTGSTPRMYEEHRLLEIAAGTGGVTRALASALPESSAIVATDLNQAMPGRRFRGRDQAPRRVAPGGCHAAAFSRRLVRCPARGASRLEEASDAAEKALSRRFGPGAADGKIQAHVVGVGK